MIVRRKDGFYVISETKGKDGNRKVLGGPYKSRKKAVKRLQQVEFFKHHPHRSI